MLETSTPRDVLSRLESVTPKERLNLVYFAQSRLAHYGLPKDDSEDLYHQALASVMRGVNGHLLTKEPMEHSRASKGRTPKPQDLASTEQFLNYLRGAINSIAEGWARTKFHKPDICSLNDMQESITTAEHNQTEFHDLRDTLFRRMRKVAHARLHPTIDAWEQAPDGRIPCVTSRKHVFAVRQLSQKIALELGLTPSTTSS